MIKNSKWSFHKLLYLCQNCGTSRAVSRRTNETEPALSDGFQRIFFIPNSPRTPSLIVTAQGFVENRADEQLAPEGGRYR